MSERNGSNASPAATRAYSERPAKKTPIALAATYAAPPTPAPTTLTRPPGQGGRSTVLPRVAHGEGVARLVLAGKPRYEAVRPLGAGGQAEVTLARDQDIDRPVAVKRLLPELVSDDAVLRFAEEIRTVGQLEHPNIVPIHDVGVDGDGRYYFVMKYVEGETLEAVIAKLRAGDAATMRRYTPEYRLQICNEILRGVEHAHALQILHRDLKPANIMIGSLGEVVIMDWGIARRDGAVEAPGALLGTPAYMAPEQAAGRLEAMDARSDVYSLALTFYEFLALRHPRGEQKTLPQMLEAAVRDDLSKSPVLADFSRAGAPAAYGHFVRHGLAHDPARRYPSVTAMRERLELVRDGKAPVECPITFTQRILDGASRGANRHPLALMGGYALGVLAALGGLATLLLHHAR
ncbi:MAG TPA: serine/threonine-protein kinase [Polyangia bacterium]|nr:serine/threonine-protein kinase [Polyangia bacterium]